MKDSMCVMCVMVSVCEILSVCVLVSVCEDVCACVYATVSVCVGG